MNEHIIPEEPLTRAELEEAAALGLEMRDLRDTLDRIAAVVNERTDPLKERMEEIKERMRGYLERVRDPRSGNSTVRAGVGSFYFQHAVSAKIKDRLALENAIKNGQVSLELFGSSLNKAYVKDYLRDHSPDCPDNEIPSNGIPGVEISKYATVLFRAK